MIKIGILQRIVPLSFPEKERAVFMCLSSDANYEAHLWVNIASLIENAKSESKYYIYILDGGIRFKENFYDLVNKDKRFHIEFIDMRDQFVFVYESRHISRAGYYRLAIFRLFKNFPRIIYIDADSYVLGDVAELYNLPMGDKLIAGAPDSITYEIPWREKYISYPHYSGKAKDYFVEYLKLPKEKFKRYFSSGVLMFNLERIDKKEKNKALEELLNREFYCLDQDIMNLLFSAEETYKLRREWNYFNSAPVLKKEDFLVKEERENYLDGKVSPKIISYVLKPWEKEHINSPYADLYWEKLKQSPYYLEILEISKKNNKVERFKKLSLSQKIKFLTSREAFQKYRSMIRTLLK
ncbi:MAG: glycosyltransferase [Candidatus Dojkabacteria bacterium]|jgi:lipopolysaccharide biosynthesis glycosyltransferase|nr:glycosyltransferase [Candidatus Dojkabacteria bacterium]